MNRTIIYILAAMIVVVGADAFALSNKSTLSKNKTCSKKATNSRVIAKYNRLNQKFEMADESLHDIVSIVNNKLNHIINFRNYLDYEEMVPEEFLGSNHLDDLNNIGRLDWKPSDVPQSDCESPCMDSTNGCRQLKWMGSECKETSCSGCRPTGGPGPSTGSIGEIIFGIDVFGNIIDLNGYEIEIPLPNN